MTMQTFRNPAGFGGALFLATVPVHLALSRDASVALAAVTLALIGGAYIGFGARAETRRTFLMELSVAILFGAAALLGLVWHWSALAIGLGLHGLWDLLHHIGLFGAPVPRWYIPFCVVFDLAAAAFVVVHYGL